MQILKLEFEYMYESGGNKNASVAEKRQQNNSNLY